MSGEISDFTGFGVRVVHFTCPPEFVKNKSVNSVRSGVPSVPFTCTPEFIKNKSVNPVSAERNDVGGVGGVGGLQLYLQSCSPGELTVTGGGVVREGQEVFYSLCLAQDKTCSDR